MPVLCERPVNQLHSARSQREVGGLSRRHRDTERRRRSHSHSRGCRFKHASPSSFLREIRFHFCLIIRFEGWDQRTRDLRSERTGWFVSNPNGIPSFSPGLGRVRADLPRVTCVCEIQPQRGCAMRAAGLEGVLQSKRNPVGVGTGGGLVPRGSPAFAGQPRAEGQNAVGVPAWPRTSQLSDESFSMLAQRSGPEISASSEPPPCSSVLGPTTSSGCPR